MGRATALQARMTELMRRIYGRNIEWWLGGLKELLVQMKIFSTTNNLLGYSVTPECRAQICAALAGTDGLDCRADLMPAAGVFESRLRATA